MRLAVISDIHANLEALQAVASAIEAEQVDRIVCLGDVVGYNADPEACLELLRRLDPIWIAGNHDRAVTGQITTAGFSKTAAHAVAWTRERLAAEHIALLAGLALRARIGDEVVAVHGAWHPAQGCESVRLDTIERRRLSLDALADDPGGARICLFGHTHRPAVAELVAGRMRDLGGEEVTLRADAHYLLNPGTVGQPWTADRRACYLVLDLRARRAFFRQTAYRYGAAAAKTRRAGLLPRFWFIPSPLRIAAKRVAAHVRGARTGS